MKINIVGLGYVGQTLAVVLADVGFKVYGSEKDEKTLESIKKCESHIKEPGINLLLKKYLNKNLFVGKPEEVITNDVDAFIIAVTSPVDKKTKLPNLEIVKSAVYEIKDRLKPGQCVFLRSTVPVGTTRNVVKPILEESGLKAGEDFYLAFTPERTAEGVALKELRMLPQIIGGINDKSVDEAAKIFRRTTPTILCVSSLEAAELIKLLDNSYRDLRFAYANEIGRYCEKIGLNTFEIVNAANQGYPRNNIPVPSPGVGGACLTKDPYILIDCAKKVGENLDLVSKSRDINEQVTKRMVEELKKHGQLKNKKIFVAGFAFKGKPETNDMRDSPTIDLVKYLSFENALIVGFDTCVEEEKIRSLGVEHVKNIEDGIKDADVAIFMTNHEFFSNLDAKEIFSKMKKDGIVYDGWGIFNKHEIEKMGLVYKGVGIG
jgi:UDP-N-acetyl-D-mannosaminuronic acid dehydrogenase